jgi:hypothetical protein
LAIQGLLGFHLNFRIFYFCEGCHWNFDGDYIEFVNSFGNIFILTIFILLIH